MSLISFGVATGAVGIPKMNRLDFAQEGIASSRRPPAAADRVRLQHPRNSLRRVLLSRSLVGIHLDQLRNAFTSFARRRFPLPAVGKVHGARVPVAVDLIVEQAVNAARQGRFRAPVPGSAS